MSLVLNMVQHALTKEQIAELEKLENIVDGKEALPSLHSKIANSPSSSLAIRHLANEVYVTILDLSEDEKVYVHLPIGSPAFMFSLGMVVGYRGKWENIRFVFSHSERISIDEKQEDGSVVKKSVFKFSHLIEI